MKKRILAVILCMSAFAVMAMGSGSSSSETKQVVAGSNTEAVSDSVSETDSAAGTEAASEADAGAAETADVTIQEQVLVDQDGIKVTATEYGKDDIWGDMIKVVVENNTDKNITVTTDALIVNDFMIEDLFSVDVAAGKKANDEITLYTSELEAAGIENVGKIEAYFRVYDSDTWDDLFTTDVVEIDTSAYDTMDTTADDSGTELYNDNGIRIVGKTVDEDSIWGTAILLYIENNSDKNVYINADNLSINGYMVDEYFSADVYAGKKDFSDITIFESDLEENGIESLDEVELTFEIRDLKTYETIAESDPITFSAQ